MKQVELSLKTAKLMYASSEQALKQFALSNYTEEELTKKEFPKSWESLEEINGSYIDTDSQIHTGLRITPFYENKNVYPTLELAKAALALAQLLQLRNRWWEIDNNWSPDYTTNDLKYGISVENEKLNTVFSSYLQHTFSFSTKEIRNEFLETFKELLEIAKPLI